MGTFKLTRRTALASALATGIVGSARAAPSFTIIPAEDGRDVRVSVWPASGARRGTILFSHGALSAPWKYERLIAPWSAQGFEVLAPLHTDSTDHPDKNKIAMADSWRTRLLDMRALSNFVDAPSYVAAGHSYGGLVAVTLGGATAIPPKSVPLPLRDRRAKAVVAFSPPGPTPTLITSEGFSTLAVPALIQTGDRDIPFGAADGRWQVHLAAYDAAPPGDKYALVLNGVDHYFGGLICEFDKPGPAQTTQLADAVSVSSDFLEAFGAGDTAARLRLDAALTQTVPGTLTRK